MERRVKFIYGLTICVIIAYSIVQGYWMYSRYQLSLEEYESELYATITACVEEDISMRKALPAPNRLYGNRSRKIDIKDENHASAWAYDIYVFDTLQKSASIPKGIDAQTYFLDYIANHQSNNLQDSNDDMEIFEFRCNNIDDTIATHVVDALDRFIANHKQPFQKVRLDSILRSKGIMPQSITTTKSDTMVWQPSVQTHGSILHPIMQVSYPYDIFEGQQVVVKTAIGMSPIIRRMTYTLLITILLSTLKMCVSFMGNERMMQDGESKQKILNSSHNELDNLTSYFSKLRDITFSDTEEIPLVKSRFALRGLMEECVSKQNTPSDKDVRMEIVAEDDLEIRADRMHLANIVCNLLENAIKYSREAVTIRIDYRMCEDGKVQICVADNGIGIAKADQRYVFDKFYRSESAKDKAIPGIGLGLSYVKLLVEAHGGNISFDSTEGEGTTFTIVIPQRDGED